MSWIDVTSPIRNVNCLLNNRCKLFAWGRWLRGFCPLPLYVGEMWKLLVCSKFKSWLYKWRLYFRFDQEAACQKALIAFFFFLLCTGKGIWFDSFLEGVCFVCGYFCVQGVCVCVWDLFASLPSPLALRIEATPASLPLFFPQQYPALCNECRKWKKCPRLLKMLLDGLDLNLFFFFSPCGRSVEMGKGSLAVWEYLSLVVIKPRLTGE